MESGYMWTMLTTQAKLELFTADYKLASCTIFFNCSML